MNAPALFQLRGRLAGERDWAALSEPVSRRDALAEFDAKIKEMRGHGFRAVMRTQAGTIRRCEIINPISKQYEAIYLVVPTGAA